jgi:5-methylcytosine-specific restriction endonuclease McrA
MKGLNLSELLCILRSIIAVVSTSYFSPSIISAKGAAFPKHTQHTAFANTPLEYQSFARPYDGEYDNLTYSMGGRVLVLNQSYEPVSVCNIKKAISLLFLMKAEIVISNESRSLRSVRSIFKHPSVIRLSRYIHVPVKKVELSRKNVMRRDAHRCQYCGTMKPPLTIDHIQPKSRGGMDTWENLTTACIKCNTKKGNRTPDEAGMKLLKTPRRPSHVTFIKNLGGEIDERWKPYLFMT